MLKGEFKPQKLNLLLVFQVNCPGCFFYALPLFNHLFQRYEKQLGFVALSTAFEDYNYNTNANTELLIQKGELVGETKKALKEQGVDKLPFPLLTPIGMDKKLDNQEKEELIEMICKSIAEKNVSANYDRNLLRKNVSDYLNKQEHVSLTFTANQFKGTPTIALFKEDNQLLNSWFGHVPVENLIQAIDQFIDVNY